MKKTTFVSLGVLLISLQFSGFSNNDLSIRQNVQHPQVASGYIDDATLVVEPYGAYCEQSLYVKYSDHGAFSGQNLLIMHSFELPQNAVANDLWLWMGDSVMQAKIFERKYAQNLWDSITNLNRDPALLKQTGSQFSLEIFPLVGGNYRKIKMRCHVPIRFAGTTPSIDLPLKFFKADHNAHPGLKILFRAPKGTWGTPKIVEAPDLKINRTIDTLSKTYNVFIINDINQFTSLTLTYNPQLSDGYCTQIFKSGTGLYYSLGVHEADFFKTPFSSNQPNKKIIALDLSGSDNVDSLTQSPQVPNFMRNYFTIKDSFKIIAAGEGLYDTFPQTGWAILDDSTIQNPLASLLSGRVLSAKASAKRPRVLFLGPSADMRFPGINQFAALDSVARADYSSAAAKLGNADIVVNYFMWAAGPASYIAAVDSFLNRGGIFIGLFCFNRIGGNIAHQYISGLPTDNYVEKLDKGLKYRTKNGNLGAGFPEKIDYDVAERIQSNDPGLVKELVDDSGYAVVASKRVGKGLFVLRSIWHMHETPGTWQTITSPLYNFQNSSKPSQLGDLLRTVNSFSNRYPFNEALLLSNSTDIITNTNLNSFVSAGLLDSLSRSMRINAISLLSGDNPSVTLNGTQYFGSEYLLDTLTRQSGGAFISLNKLSWNQLSGILGKDIMPAHTQFSFSATVNGVPDSNAFISSTNPGDLRFFTGKIQSTGPLTFSVQSKYKNFDSLFSRKISIPADSSSYTDSSLFFWYGQYFLKQMLSASKLDTQKIVTFATQNRLLCDFTAFIALEPNKDNPFLNNPKDESVIRPTAIKNALSLTQKLNVSMSIVPGLFPTFLMHSPFAARVELCIFDLSGKKLASLTSLVKANNATSIVCNKIKFAVGMYIAVAKVFPLEMSQGNNVKTIISQFSVK
jgi:hypothetical protein